LLRLSALLLFDDDNDNDNNNNNNNNGIHTPKPVFDYEDVTVLWSQRIHRDRVVTAKRPDTIIKNQKEKKVRILIDMAILAKRNVTQKAAEKD
jgi:hypothetical protein